ncbi:hypothetical protein GLOIN_2v1488591 [Rhizophagus irregularis DAOM 181602=DAOM 197198]|nr:hypothetical protein GLOIN_2v1488591 [Rhizophagus irregularis DAOM 181602=DAOM 197198]
MLIKAWRSQLNERYRKSFSDYRYQLKNVLSTLVKEFRQIVESEYTESSDPTDEEVTTSYHINYRILQKMLQIVWVETESANIKEKVKELDVITEDLEFFL